MSNDMQNADLNETTELDRLRKALRLAALQLETISEDAERASKNARQILHELDLLKDF